MSSSDLPQKVLTRETARRDGPEPLRRFSGTKRWLSLVLYVAAFCALLLFGWRHLEASRYEWNVSSWSALIVAVLAQGGAVVAATVAWRLAIEVGGGQVTRLRDAAFLVCVNLVGKYLPGRVWGLVLRHKALLSRGSSNRQAVAALGVEQVTMVLTAGVLAAPGLVNFIEMAPDWTSVLVIVGAITALLLLRRQWLQALQAIGGRLTWRRAGKLCLASLAQWLLTGSSLLLVALGLGIPLDWSAASSLMSAVPAAVVAGMAIFIVPGGIGVREGVIVLLCGPIIGVSEALACAVTLRIVATVRDALCGLAIPLLLGKPGASG